MTANKKSRPVYCNTLNGKKREIFRFHKSILAHIVPVCKCFANEPELGCFVVSCVSVVLGLLGLIGIVSVVGIPLGAYLAPMLMGGITFLIYAENGMRWFRWAIQASWVIGNLVLVSLILLSFSYMLYVHIRRYKKLIGEDEAFREQVFSNTSWYGMKILLYKVYTFVTLRLPRVAGRGERRWMIILGVKIPLK